MGRVGASGLCCVFGNSGILVYRSYKSLGEMGLDLLRGTGVVAMEMLLGQRDAE